MEYEKALKVCEIVKEIELNNKDIDTFSDALKDGIEAAEMHVRSKKGNYYSSTIYRKDRIDMLLQVLYSRNDELMQKLAEL